jgi:hypothetical protein
MKLFVGLLLAIAPSALADGTMETLPIVKPPCNTTKPECVKDMDCPQIFCIQAPCPIAVCRSGKCVTVLPPVPTKPIAPPVRAPATVPIKPPVSPPLRAPVAPVTAPIGTGLKCGKNVCKVGDECCNASCGICTPKGGACIQIACVDHPTSSPTSKPRFVVAPTPIARPPIRAPVPTGIKCGPTMCNSTQVCCNESCGICTPPGGVCTKQFCDFRPTSPPVKPITPPVRAPVSVPVKCGDVMCTDGKVCCNESCSICTKVGEGCNKMFCIKTTKSPTKKPYVVIRPRSLSPVNKPGYCKVDSDCPVPPCAKPIDDTIDFYCPIPICVRNQCQFAPRPTRKPSPKPISPPPGYCKLDNECPTPICLPGSKECPIGKCVNNKCTLVVVPPVGTCKVDADCPVACSPIVGIDGKPGPCTTSYCVNNQCSKVPPPPTKCGNVMCTSDEYCCNESCGDCIHKLSKRACNMQICSPAVQCRNDMDCKLGKTCSNGQCIWKQVVEPVPCGKNTCTGGDVCCDPLCGTCTKPGMLCPLGCSIEDPLA